MELPFSTSQLKEILGIDTGFKNFLNSMPDDQKIQLEEILANESILLNALNSIQTQHRDQVLEFFNNIINTPETAIRYYKQCRFFEARELLLKSVDLYADPPQSSADFLNKSVEFVTKRVKALCYVLLGEVEGILGNSVKAGQYHKSAYQLAEETGDIDTRVKALQGLGTYNWSLGNFEKGFDYCHQALDIISGQKDRWQSKCKILTTLSTLYSEIGQFDLALEYSINAVDLCIQMDDRKALPICLNNLACLYQDFAEYAKAIEALEVGLEITEEENELHHEALLLNNLAICCFDQSEDINDRYFAESLLNEALLIARNISSASLQALATNNLGGMYKSLGRIDDARKAFLDSLKIYQRLGAQACQAGVLSNLGQLLKEDTNDLEGACQSFRSAIDIVEKIRGSLKKEIHRISYADTATDPYEMIVDCLLSLNRPDKALEYIERSKSRALLEFLSLRLRKQIVEKSNPEVFREASILMKEMDEIQKNLTEIFRRDESGGDPEITRGGVNEVEILTSDLMEKFTEKERQFEPVYSSLIDLDAENASLMNVMPISTTSLQGQLDKDTLFIEFYQTEENLYMFILSHDVEVRVTKIDISLSEAEETVWNLSKSMMQESPSDLRSHDYIRELRKPLEHFFNLLINPVKPFLLGYKRLIIAPHLFWHYLPFHALYDRIDKIFVCDRFEVGYCPSGSILNLCLQKPQVNRNHALVMSLNTGDLPYADQEADRIAALFHPNIQVRKGFEAHLGQIRNTNKQYNVIHLVCHGQFNPESPFLSGINIPPNQNEKRHTRLLDLFNLKMESALVTLSACESGLSCSTRADELIGLNRGLFYAGAASVMLSLWRASDQSTCELMENFYWHYVANRQTKTRSLQLAMQALKARPEYAHPYYWAPFFLTGDWR